MTSRTLQTFAVVCALVAVSGTAQAAPVFYVSNQNAGAVPGLLDLVIAPNSTGTLHIWVDTDIRLSAVSLDLVETGGAIKFTGLDVHNPFLPGPRWAILNGPQEVTDSAVNHIGGSLLPGPFGRGIGPGVPDGPRVLLASVDYMALNSPGAKSDLSLRVGRQTISDFDGNPSQIRFGTANSPLVPGGVVGPAGGVGSITLGGSFAPVITPVHLGEIEQTTTIFANVTACNCPITWSGLTSVAGNPALPATLTPAGAFSRRALFLVCHSDQRQWFHNGNRTNVKAHSRTRHNDAPRICNIWIAPAGTQKLIVFDTIVSRAIRMHTRES